VWALRCRNGGSVVSTSGSTNMRLAVRIIIALVVTVLSALVLYFVFLRNDRPAHDQVQRANNHVGSSPVTAVAGLRRPNADQCMTRCEGE
jgi:hypothetical protein